MKWRFVSAIAALGICCSNSRAAPAAIRDCDSFQAWFKEQPASVLTLVSGDTRKVPKPKSKTSLVIDVKGATGYKGRVGGGGCLSGWYDPVHHLAALREQYDTYQDLLIFYPTSTPVGVRTRDLSRIALENGIRLGMTEAAVETIEGKGFVTQFDDGIALHYRWIDQIYYDLSFRFRKQRLIAIDYGYGG